MSDEKLTVAELLARAKKDGGQSTSSAPRRRRRSLEEGGISVSELTGSFPKVDAEGPRRGSHSLGDSADSGEVDSAVEDQLVDEAVVDDVVVDEVVDEEAPVDESLDDENVADATESDEVAEPAEVTEPADFEEVTESDEASVDEAVGESADSATVVDEAPLDVAEIPAEDTWAGADADETVVAESELDEEVAAEEAGVEETVPLAVPMAPMPVLTDHERGEVTFTFTDLRDAETGERTVAPAGPIAKMLTDSPTPFVPVVVGAGAAAAAGAAATAGETEPETSELSAIEEQEPVHPENVESPQDLESTAIIEAVPDDAEFAGDEELVDESYDDEFADDEFAGGEDFSADSELVAEGATSDDTFAESESEDSNLWGAPAAAGAATAVGAAGAAGVAAAATPRVDEDVNDTPDNVPATVDTDSALETDEDEDYNEDNSLSIALLIVQVFVGIMIGALCFLGFTLAWESLPKAVTAILGVVFAAGLGFGANALRRKRDWITPVLAALVGLVLAFAPYVLISG
ncbi:hypothetical protein [Corynebacterium sp. H113]|uniref:hypothetical protein n=1 Tax=Corynebacterium sp. H113 TaxID=3133419 RepID=UPI0030AE5615